MPTNIRVVNMNAWGIRPDEDEVLIRVDRSNPVLGNSFRLARRRDPAERDRVIALFEAKLLKDINEDGPMSQAITDIAQQAIDLYERSGQNIALACWCSPLPCHAEIIRDAVIKRIQELVEIFDQGQNMNPKPNQSR